MTEHTNAMSSTPGVHKIDGSFYWDTVKFSVQGWVFKVPGSHFVQGSDHFSKKYLWSVNDDEEVPIVIEGVTAHEFRTFLKILFPIHNTSTTTTFTKPEWHIILTLSTLWHFNHLRKLAIEHLEPLNSDSIELIKAGRAAFIVPWVMAGYEQLVTRLDAISEKESEVIGHLTTVRLYIIRHDLQVELEATRQRGYNDEPGKLRSVGDYLQEKFVDEAEILKAQESERRTKEDIQWEEQKGLETKRIKEEKRDKRRLGEVVEMWKRRREEAEEMRRNEEILRLEEVEKMRLEEAERVQLQKQSEEEERMRLKLAKEGSKMERRNWTRELKLALRRAEEAESQPLNVYWE